MSDYDLVNTPTDDLENDLSNIPRHITTSLPKALTAIRAVLELHKAVFDIHDPDARAYCHECGYRPCATVQAIEGAINHE